MLRSLVGSEMCIRDRYLWMDGWMDGWMDEWTDEQMDKPTDELSPSHSSLSNISQQFSNIPPIPIVLFWHYNSPPLVIHSSILKYSSHAFLHFFAYPFRTDSPSFHIIILRCSHIPPKPSAFTNCMLFIHSPSISIHMANIKKMFSSHYFTLYNSPCTLI